MEVSADSASAADRVLASSRAMNATCDRLSALMERYARGEDRVFEQLYGLLAPRIHRFCVRLANSVVEADDCFQETFLKLHRARATYVTGANPLHWAFAIARSVYLTRLRYWRRRPEHLGATHDVAEAGELQVHDTTPEAEVAAEHLHDTLACELSRMSEKNRVAYVLLKEENLSAREAAAVLGTTADAVKQRAHRAYQNLKSALNTAGWSEYGNPV